ncbi:MAG: RNA polymerase sigma factor [Planctomycetes bacterium]|nr:RNA polymerase sigma factor [Planctomycetota bacterium]
MAAGVDALSDEEVERAWRAGASAGLGELFRRHYRGLVGYLVRFTRDLGAAEDLAQQAFVRLLDRRAAAGAGGRFRALVYTAARNLALNERRRQGRRYVARASLSALPEEPPARPVEPLEALVADEELAAFRAALAALPSDERAAFDLKEVQGLTYAEAGARLGLHPDAVRRRVARAYARLRGAVGA